MTRIAKCQSGELEVECEGEPGMIATCYWEFCQRATGSSYNLGAWFPKANVSIRGETKEYVRTGDAGSTITIGFCPNCGSSVYWNPTGDLSEQYGVAVGCFVDPDFPSPTVSVYGKRGHKWLTPPNVETSFLGSRGSAPDSGI
jgi:hypothetical protein